MPTSARSAERRIRRFESPARPTVCCMLGSVQKADLPAVVAQMKQRFDREAPSQAKDLWSAAYILMGLRYESAMVQSLLRGVMNMKESTTYQAILEEGEAIGVAKGKAAEARKMLLL